MNYKNSHKIKIFFPIDSTNKGEILYNENIEENNVGKRPVLADNTVYTRFQVQ